MSARSEQAQKMFSDSELVDPPLNDEERLAFYKSHRERWATTLKPKHLRQYDIEFAQLTGATSSMAVLEIGCGTGLFLRYLEKRGYRHICGVDIDENLADALSDLSHAQIHFGDALELIESGRLSGSFDRIVLLDLIEHLSLEKIRRLLEGLHNLLTPDGRILIRTPNLTSPWGLKIFFDSFDHVTPLTPGRLRELAVMTGYDCLTLCPQPVRRWRKRILEMALHRLFNFMLNYHPDIWSANCLAVYTHKNGPT